nr:PREDICTED: 39S ribosomal protein L1, mitochondrial [Bemisia tabaci]XP_018905199.1 PREDICTED: 39S ribosomal protein L1, mitochondrial [Bemisia tabaci]
MALLLQNISRLSQSPRLVVSNLSPMQQRFRARKGTRERKEKKKVKKEVIKQPWMPIKKTKTKGVVVSPRVNDELLTEPPDNVWFLKDYKRPVYSFAEALGMIREVHHPTVYNQPKSLVNAYIELDLRTAKKTKFVERFTRLVGIPYPYDHGEERTVIAFCKNQEIVREANDAGAQMAGGTQLIKAIEKGQIMLPDFQFVVAHPDIVPELVSLRYLMRKNFPSLAHGTLSTDVAGLVRKCMTGVRYSSMKHEIEQDYGWVDTPLGRISMETPHLEANLIELLKDIEAKKPRRDNPFITRVMLSTPLLTEKLWVDWKKYLGETPELDSDDEDEKEAAV